MNEEFSSVLNKALRFLSFRPRSKHEILVYLDKKGAGEELKNKILEKLEKLKFIDDEGFARWWLEGRTTTSPRSIRVIKFELKQKGVSPEIIDQVVEGFSCTDEFVSAQRVAEKKLRKLGNLTELEIKRKLFQALSSRGFSYEVAKEIIDKLLKKE